MSFEENTQGWEVGDIFLYVDTAQTHAYRDIDRTSNVIHSLDKYGANFYIEGKRGPEDDDAYYALYREMAIANEVLM